MLLGAHESIAGGLYKAIERAIDDGCESLQIFSKNSNRWKAKDISEEEAERFRHDAERSGLAGIDIHTSYLINIGSPDDTLWEKSREALKVEVERAHVLGIPYIVLHPGSHVGSGLDNGIKRIAEGLNSVIAETPDDVVILLENTAGQGTNIGHRFEHIAEIIGRVDDKKRVAVCFDTCHAFAAGYDIRAEESYNRVMDEFDDIIGLELLRVFHLNDSKMPFGSRRDRHEQIGDGEIGLEAFRLLMNDERFESTPGVLETPPLQSGEKSYKRNLAVLRGLIGREERIEARGQSTLI